MALVAFPVFFPPSHPRYAPYGGAPQENLTTFLVFLGLVAGVVTVLVLLTDGRAFGLFGLARSRRAWLWSDFVRRHALEQHAHGRVGVRLYGARDGIALNIQLNDRDAAVLRVTVGAAVSASRLVPPTDRVAVRVVRRWHPAVYQADAAPAALSQVATGDDAFDLAAPCDVSTATRLSQVATGDDAFDQWYRVHSARQADVQVLLDARTRSALVALSDVMPSIELGGVGDQVAVCWTAALPREERERARCIAALEAAMAVVVAAACAPGDAGLYR